MTSKIEENWEYYGAENPYYAVLSEEKYRDENLSGEVLADFFASGEEYVNRIWKVVEQNFGKDFHPARALDFGCGVGRLTLPLAAKCDEIIGVDIAENMLVEARKNCEKLGVKNAKFIKGDNNLSKINEKFDFVHSFIVFQHIEPKLGEKIARRLIESLNPGGVGVLHFTYRNKASKASQMRVRLYRAFPFIHKLRTILLKDKNEGIVSLIPMNVYNLNNLLAILQQENCHECSIRFSDHGFDGAVLFFRKGKKNLF